MLWRKVSNYFSHCACKRKNVWLLKKLLEHKKIAIFGTSNGMED